MRCNSRGRSWTSGESDPAKVASLSGLYGTAAAAGCGTRAGRNHADVGMRRAERLRLFGHRMRAMTPHFRMHPRIQTVATCFIIFFTFTITLVFKKKKTQLIVID